MAALSQTATALTPSTSSPDEYSWNISARVHSNNSLPDNNSDARFRPSSRLAPRPSQNGNSPIYNSNMGSEQAIAQPGRANRNVSPDMSLASPTSQNLEAHHEPAQAGQKAGLASPADSIVDLNGPGRSDSGATPEDQPSRTNRDGKGAPSRDEHSKWIHRDKLARIENEELQAAGIVLPRTRSEIRSKSRPRTAQRSRQNSTIEASEINNIVPSWDLRLPEEIADESYWTASGIPKGGSRIPVAKTSPAPVPAEHLERDRLLARKRESSVGEEESIKYPKPRTASGASAAGTTASKTAANGTGTSNPYTTSSASISQPKRADTSPKKGPGKKPLKPSSGAAGRSRARGSSREPSGSANGRPTTRSGERELAAAGSSKQMEGEPPWMVSAYKPDPRLPPEQQLLPTVARRLQQEKWEREGKFGSVYDKEFRPLTDDGFTNPPEPEPVSGQEAPVDRETSEDATQKVAEEAEQEWPLKVDTTVRPPASPSQLTPRLGSYSTMPKITDKQNQSPVASPLSLHPPPMTDVIRIPEPVEEPEPEKEDPKASCGCCIVM